MRIVKILVYVAFLTILATGAGFVWARISEHPTAAVAFGTWLVRSLYVAGAALGAAVAVGLYHLYLYLFTERRPLGLFATTEKDEPPR